MCQAAGLLSTLKPADRAAGSALIRLELNDNPLTEEAAPPLGAMLRQQPHLLRLNLSDTSMCDEGISTLAEALSEGAQPSRSLA